MSLRDLSARALVVLKAAPTWLTSLAVAITLFHEDIAGLLPAAWQGPVASGLVIVLGTIASAIVVIRRVTPVAESLRGLIPPDSPPD